MENRSGMQTAAESVFADLAAQIIAGSYRPGKALPSEAELASHYEVSRSILREALGRLAYSGLIVSRRGAAARVANWSQTAGLDVLPFLLTERDGPAPEVVSSTFELRELIYADGARLCAIRANLASRKEIVELADDLANRPNPTRADHVPFSPYWNLILNASGNIAYRLTINALNVAAARGVGSSPILEAPYDPIPLVRLAAAIAAEDPVRAEELGRFIARDAREFWMSRR